MGRRAKTQHLLDVAISVLSENHPMTVRQVYYQLVVLHVIENTRTQYQAISNLLVDARQEGLVPWEWVEDRNRRPRHIPMWESPKHFAHVVRQYRRDVWATQPAYVEVWLEKDALSGIFQEVLTPYGVTLNVGRGYDGWDSIHNAAERYQTGNGVTVLYFGDFDPSGEDMVRSLEERLGFFQCYPEIIKCALTPEDIRRYKLPPDFAKRTDSRAAGFIARHGDVSVELDALSVAVLRERIETEVRKRMDLQALAELKEREDREREHLFQLLSSVQ